MSSKKKKKKKKKREKKKRMSIVSSILKKNCKKINTYHAQESFSVEEDFTPLKSS